MKLIVALVVSIAAQDAGRAEREELMRLEQVWNEAHVRGDAEALDRLWAEDMTVTVPGMAPMTKSDSMGVWRSGRMKFDRYASSDVQVRLHGDTAVVTGRANRLRQAGGRSQEDDWRFTKVYVRHGGGWRVVAFHASPAPPE